MGLSFLRTGIGKNESSTVLVSFQDYFNNKNETFCLR